MSDEDDAAKIGRKKPGRKKIENPKSKRLEVRLTSEQLEHIEERSEEAGMSKTDYLLSFVPDLPPSPKSK